MSGNALCNAADGSPSIALFHWACVNTRSSRSKFLENTFLSHEIVKRDGDIKELVRLGIPDQQRADVRLYRR
jgi:hypothetical protein